MEWIQKNILQLILLLVAGAVLTGSIAMQYPPQLQATSTAVPDVVSTTETPQFTATPSLEEVIRLAWFYKPPDSSQMASVADQVDFFILTHKVSAQWRYGPAY